MPAKGWIGLSVGLGLGSGLLLAAFVCAGGALSLKNDAALGLAMALAFHVASVGLIGLMIIVSPKLISFSMA